MSGQVSVSGSSGVPRRSRRWWQHLLRAGLIAVVVLIGAYLTMPWWLPTGHLRRWMSAEITRQTGLDVDCFSLSVSWSRDIEIQRLVLKEPSGFDPGEMVFIDRLRCDFSPLELLVFHRIEWMTLEGLRVHIKFDKDGKANIAALTRIKPDVQTRHIQVIDGIAHVALPGLPEGQKLDINNIEYLAGRDSGPGRVTMAAMLNQVPRGAPVSLHLSVGLGAQDSARVGFTDVDLAQLPLKKIIPSLPMKTLSGVAAGSLDLSLAPHQSGQLPFKIDLSIRNLEVQPEEGPHLPVVAQAGLSLDALYQFSGLLTINDMRIALPGIALRGRGQIATGAEMSWRSIENVVIEAGTIHPTRLVALLTGKAGPIGDLTINGPVTLQDVRLTHDWPMGDFSGTIDASNAELLRGTEVIKPARRRLRLSVDGKIDHRTTALTLDRAGLDLGDNTLQIHGRLANLRETISHWTSPRSQPTTQAAMRDLLAADLSGQYELADTEALVALLGPAGQAWNQVILDGQITGLWALRPGRHGLRLTADVNDRTLCTIAKRLVKPPGKGLHVDLAATLDPDAPAVTDLDLGIVCGTARVNVEDASIRRLQGPASGWDLSARMGLRDLRALLAWAPDRPDSLRDLAGRATIACRMQLRPEEGRINGQWRFTDLDISARWPGTSDPPAKVHATGMVNLQADVTAKSDAAEAIVTFGGDGLAVNIDGPVARSKGAGVPASAAVVVRVRREDSAWQAVAESVELLLGGSVLRASAAATILPPDKQTPEGAWRLGPHSLQAGAVLQLDKPLMDIAAELRNPVKTYGLAGRAEATIVLHGDGPRSDLTARLDATALAATTLPHGLTKPADLPARLEAAIMTDDRKAFEVTSLTAALGKIALRGSGRVLLITDDTGSRRLDCPRGTATVTVDDLAALETLAPALQRYVPAGRVRAEARWETPKTRKIPSLNITAENVSARYQGKAVSINGTAEITDAVLDGMHSTLGRFRTEGLDLRIGDNVVRAVMDLRNLPEHPAGEFNVYAPALDLPDLTAWVVAPTTPVAQPIVTPATTQPASQPVSQPATQPVLTEDQITALRGKAESAIARVRPYVLGADLSGRVDVRKLAFLDRKVNVVYHPQNLVARIAVVRGQIELSYAAMISGGVINRRFAVNLADDLPILSEQEQIKDVLAGKEMQPQLEVFFPGNKVSGTFNHTTKLSTPLVDVIAAAMNPAYRPRTSGTATTVTTDGVVSGRAAPKIVTRVFPGLNLTHYPYKKMTAFATFTPDGAAENDMIFEGQTYDLYMEGTTDAENVARYEVGVILLNSPQSPEFNHRLHTGRLAIFKTTSLIINGKRLNEEISYLWPTEHFVNILVRDNSFYRLWVEKRRGGATPGPEVEK